MVEARLLDDVGRGCSPAQQMAIDEELLTEVRRGALPAVRLYTWAAPALSIGRFQPTDDLDRLACERRGVEVVRRPSGGRALLHGGDLTYAVAMRRPHEPVRTTFCHIAQGLIEGLSRLGVDSALTRRDGASGPACFTGAAGADLRVGDRKLCGSAMVRRGDAVLQHGSVLLHRLAIDESELLRGTERDVLRRATVTLGELHAPTAAEEVAAALVEGFAAALDLDLHLTSSTALPDAQAGRSLNS